MVVSVNNGTDIGHIFVAISQLQGVSEVRLQEEVEFFPISGLPYTYEERMKDVCRAEEDYAMGKTTTSEELKRKVTLW
jgi:hypothetical protein